MARSGVVLAVVLVTGAFAAGLGLGLVAGDPAPPSEHDGPPGGAESEIVSDATSETDGPANADTAERRRRRDADSAHRPAAAGASSGAAADPGGSGTITGSVKTASGTPVEGVRIVSRPQSGSGAPSTRRPAPFDERDLGELVRELEERYHRTRRLRREGVTAADGTFAIDDVTDGKHRLSLKKKGYRFQPAPGAKGLVGAAGDALDFTGVPVVAVTIDVRMPDGSPPETAYVSVKQTNPHGGSSSRNERWYRDEPEIEVEPGTYTLRATAQGETPLRSKDVPLVVGESASGETVLLELGGAPMVRVNLSFAEGEVWPSMHLRLLRTAKGARHDRDRLQREGRMAGMHQGRGSGDFMDVVPGTYLVGASVSNGQILALEEVEVRDGPTVVDLVIPPLARDQYAVLEVADPAGEPLSAIACSTGFRRGGSSTSGGSNVLAKGEGVFWVLHQDSSRVSSGGSDEAVWWIDVKLAVYGSRKVEYRDTSNTELRVQFEEPASLDVELAGFVGRGLDGLLAVSVGNPGSRHHYGHNRSGPQVDEAGRYRVPVLAPGEHDVVVSIRHGNNLGEIARQTVLARSGKNDVSIALPALHSLTVELSGDAATGTVGMYMRERNRRVWIQPRRPDEAGRVLFEHLPAGEYQVQVYNVKNVKPRKVKLPDESVVRF